MTECSDIDLDAEDYVLNRARLYRDRRDFVIEAGDKGVYRLMQTPELGRIEQVSIRCKVWNHDRGRLHCLWTFANNLPLL